MRRFWLILGGLTVGLLLLIAMVIQTDDSEVPAVRGGKPALSIGALVESDSALVGANGATRVATSGDGGASVPAGIRVEVKPGIHFQHLSEVAMPAELREAIQRDVDNLRMTGSMSGGVVTHEFARLDDFAESLNAKGFDGLRHSLAIQSTDLGTILGKDFRLIGADTQSKFIEGRGWVGFFQAYGTADRRSLVELSEAQYEVAAGDGALAIRELVNAQVTDRPAILESIRTPSGEYLFNMHWFAGDRGFVLTAKNLPSQAVQAIAESITRRFDAMSNGGWARPYAPDAQSSPLQRLLQAAQASSAASGTLQ